MTHLMNHIPDFEGQRKKLVTGLQFPCEVDFDKEAYDRELAKYERLCADLNRVTAAYKEVFLYADTFEGFKKDLLPLVIRMPDRKTLAKELKSRWLEHQNVSIQLNGNVQVNKEKGKDFLIGSVDFPESLERLIEDMFNTVRGCFVPAVAGYQGLYNQDKGAFEVSAETKAFFKKKYTQMVLDEKHAMRHLLKYQLADALNGLRECGHPINENLPPAIGQLLEREGMWQHGFTFRVSPQKYPVQAIQVEIVPGSVKDPNEYGPDGNPVNGYRPVQVQATINGILNDIRLPVASLGIPGKNHGRPVRSIEIANDPAILAEVVWAGGPTVECQPTYLDKVTAQA